MCSRRVENPVHHARSFPIVCRFKVCIAQRHLDVHFKKDEAACYSFFVLNNSNVRRANLCTVYWNLTDIDGVRPVIRPPIESDTIRPDTLKLEADGVIPVAISQFTIANSPTEKPAAFNT